MVSFFPSYSLSSSLQCFLPSVLSSLFSVLCYLHCSFYCSLPCSLLWSSQDLACKIPLCFFTHSLISFAHCITHPQVVQCTLTELTYLPSKLANLWFYCQWLSVTLNSKSIFLIVNHIPPWGWSFFTITPMCKTTPQGGYYITCYLGNTSVEERYEQPIVSAMMMEMEMEMVLVMILLMG